MQDTNNPGFIHERVKFPCVQCHYKATSKENLLDHIKSSHERVNFPFDQCDIFSANVVQVLNTKC